MSFKRVVNFAKAATEEGGKHWTSFIHKTTSPVLGSAANWADLSVGAGIPRYNAYVGVQYEFTPLTGSGNFGLYTGPTPAAGEDKVILDCSLQCSTANMAPAYYMLLDYLGHYPLVDCDSTDVQAMDNTAGLTRYTSGDGVQIMAVCTVPQTATATGTISYTNNAGTAGRTATFYVAAANIGTINCANGSAAGAGQRTPFVPLRDNDGGVRSIESVTFNSSAGGFLSLVLVKPLLQKVLRETSTVVEKTPFIYDGGRAPKVLSGACLNHIFTSGASAASSIVRGHVTFVWG